MIMLLGSNNDLRKEDGVITKWGYLVAIASTVFGCLLFSDRQEDLWEDE